MKIKLDFVSNSSTANMIVYGYKIPDMDYKLFREKFINQVIGEEYNEDDYYDVLNSNDFDLHAFDEDELIIGKILFRINSDDEGFYESQYKVSELNLDEGLKRVKEVFNLDDEPMLMGFTISC